MDRLALAAEFAALFAVAAALALLTIRLRRRAAYRVAVGVALAAGFLLVWTNLAVGIIGEPDEEANAMYVGVLAVGLVGAAARLRPGGMALALLGMVLVQALVTAIVLLAGLGTATTGTRETLTMNGVFIALFAASSWLFLRAARDPRAGAAIEG